MSISMVVCTDNYGGIALNGKIPWISKKGKSKYPEDFAHFKTITDGKICLMGRHTYEEIVAIAKKRMKKSKRKLKEILPNRQCFILSSSPDFKPKYGTAVSALQPFLLDHANDEVVVIGGLQLYRQLLPYTLTVHMSVIDQDYKCNVHFPVDYVHEHFTISNGTKTENVMFVEYTRRGFVQ